MSAWDFFFVFGENHGISLSDSSLLRLVETLPGFERTAVRLCHIVDPETTCSESRYCEDICEKLVKDFKDCIGGRRKDFSSAEKGSPEKKLYESLSDDEGNCVYNGIKEYAISIYHHVWTLRNRIDDSFRKKVNNTCKITKSLNNCF